MEDLQRVRYAGFWIRLVAMMIDVIVLMIVIPPVLLWLYGIEYFDPDVMIRRSMGCVEFLIWYVFPAVAAIVLWKYKSATPGKMIVGVKIVDARTGKKPSMMQCIVRYFAYFVSTIPFGLGYLWIAFDRRKQAWHDKLAGTVVVREKMAATR
jgi:uncharacterized RDD family membrane protein YckC